MTDLSLNEWNRWYNKFVHPIFLYEEREKYYDYIKRIQPPFYPQFWIAEKFFTTIKDDSRFDNELKEFFSFLYSCGFFMENIIDFEDWLSMKNWENPSARNENSETILEILNKENGIKELKIRLRWLPFLNRQDGF